MGITKGRKPGCKSYTVRSECKIINRITQNDRVKIVKHVPRKRFTDLTFGKITDGKIRLSDLLCSVLSYLRTNCSALFFDLE